MQGASFVIDDLGFEATRDLGIPATAIHVSVTPFGSGGPRSDWQGGELVASAMGGSLRVTGEPGRPPVKEAGDACTFHADMAAAAGAMAAHYARGTHGQGQHVDVSIQQVAFSRGASGTLVWQFDRRKLGRVGGKLAYGKVTVRAIWRLADGWCFHALMTGSARRTGEPGAVRLDGRDAGRQPAARRRLAGLQPLYPAGRDAGGLGGGNRRLLRQQDQARDRHRGPAPRNQRLRGQRTGRRPGRSAPRRARVLRHAGRSAAALRRRPRRRRLRKSAASPAVDRPGPLSGVRVLDFAWALVGSITTKTLGDLGADVVKIESRTRPDLVAPRRAGFCVETRRIRRQAVVRPPQLLETQRNARPEESRGVARCCAH